VVFNDSGAAFVRLGQLDYGRDFGADLCGVQSSGALGVDSSLLCLRLMHLLLNSLRGISS